MSRIVNKEDFEDEFKTLFLTHFKRLCSYTRTFLYDEEIAKDIVHDAFMELWTHRNTVILSEPLYPYLLRTIRNKCINYLNKEKLKQRFVNTQLSRDECFTEIPLPIEDDVLRKILDLIEALPVQQKQVLRLFFFEAKSYKEIAEQLNVSVNTVKTHMSKGMASLRGSCVDITILLTSFLSVPNF